MWQGFCSVNASPLWTVSSLLFIRADQTFFSPPQLERADSFPTENMTTQKIICQIFFWVPANFHFLVVVHTWRFPTKSCKCSKSGGPFCRTLCVYFPRGWFLHACVSGFLSMAWVRLPLEKELAPWIQHGRHADNVCCAIYFIF